MSGEIDDLFDMLESKEKPFKEEKPAGNTYNNGGNGYNKFEKKENLWDAADINPVKINIDELTKNKKTYAIAYYGAVPETVKTKMLELVKILANKGFVFRQNGNSDDAIQNEVRAIEGSKVEAYVPFKKFNPNVKGCNVLDRKAYGIAANSHKVFTKLQPAVRAILANNVQTMLGKDCNEPLDFLITYTSCGNEAMVRNMDFKVTGTVVFFLKVCEDANIPVFNLKNDDAIKRIAEYLKSQSSNQE